MSYTTATFTRIDKNADGRIVLVLRYTGNAGEAPIEYSYPVDASTPPTADFMRGLAMDRIAILNNNLNFLAGAIPNLGTVLDTTTALPPPAASTFGMFMAASAPFTPGAIPQDVFTITGSATRVVQVLSVGLTTVQTTAGLNAWAVVKRSTANTGGTSALVTGVPASKAFPAATATVRQYTANPTAGTLIGSIWTGRIPAQVPASALGLPIGFQLDFSRIGQVITLTGTTDVLAWNFGGAALPTGLSVQALVWWTEN